MKKKFIISINALIDTFSRVESGKNFNFSIKASNNHKGLKKISVTDKVIASIDNKVFYNFDVVDVEEDGQLKLKKIFEIKTSISHPSLGAEGVFTEISDDEYNSICSKLFNEYQDCSQRTSFERSFLPIKEKHIGRFVFKVLSYLHGIDGLDGITPYLKRNAKTQFVSIKKEDINLTSIFRTSEEKLLEKDVVSGSKPRNFVEKELFRKDGQNYYLSTEWTSGVEGRLDLISFKELIKACYPGYYIHIDGDFYEFSLKESQEFNTSQINFNFEDFQVAVEASGLKFSDTLIQRFVASLQTKPFVILTGLSGSGKTKLAEVFSSWICEFDNQVRMVAVGADWTNSEPLLGFPNILESGEYIKPESGALDLILAAKDNPDYPYFLILDEMNMSHVERYFADFLSSMESSKPFISLHSSDKIKEIPKMILLPENLFIVGTVNVDETTYMFSPKVLDRANVVEFRVSKDEMNNYFISSDELDMGSLESKGSCMAQSFVATSRSTEKKQNLGKLLMPFFNTLQSVGAEFGYRSASEIATFVYKFEQMNADGDKAIDAAIAQKLLPKLHGSRNKLERILKKLAIHCVNDANDDDIDLIFDDDLDKSIKYSITYKKLKRMHVRVVADGFTSFAEA